MKRTILVAFVLCLSAGTLARGTTVEPLALEDLVKRAHHIVSGKVRNSRTYWSANRALILTSYAIEIDESIKGRPPRALELTTIGGKIGDLELHVSGMPSFAKDENVIVFTESSGPYEVVMGLGQGKFTLENGEVFNDVTGLSFPNGRPAKPMKLPIETFKRQIRTILTR